MNRDRGNTFEDSKLDQIVDDAGWAGSHGLLDLVVFRATGGDRIKHLSRQIAAPPLRRENVISFGKKSSARSANEMLDVPSNRRALVPPLEIQFF